jgi:hypothetical protein
MAKPIIVSFSGNASSFTLNKLERSKLYQTRKRMPLDSSGEVCLRAAMTGDGANVIKSGMAAQGYFAEDGRWVPKEELVGINPDGTVAELKPSTLGVEQQLLGPISPRELLDLDVVATYALAPEAIDDALLTALRNGDLFRFPFNYGADYNCETAYLLANGEGIFAVVGNPTTPLWVEEAEVFVAEPSDDTADDDLDFEMM